MMTFDPRSVDISQSLLESFALALVPEIRSFYKSEEGQNYFREWLKNHPEYDDSAHSTSESNSI